MIRGRLSDDAVKHALRGSWVRGQGCDLSWQEISLAQGAGACPSLCPGMLVNAARLAFQSFSSPPLSRCLLVTCPRCRLVANETSNADSAHVRSKQTGARVYSERADQFGREHRPHAMRDSVHKRLSESRNHSSNASREPLRFRRLEFFIYILAPRLTGSLTKPIDTATFLLERAVLRPSATRILL